MPDKTLPLRKDIPENDTWDLASLFKSDDDWKSTFNAVKNKLPEFKHFEGKLNTAENVLQYLQFNETIEKDAERVGVYSYLRYSEDVADAKAQEMHDLAIAFSGQYQEATSFVQPELLELNEDTWNKILADERLKLYALKLQRLAKERPHTLSKPEEKILAQLTDISTASSKAFNLLNNADLKFGKVTDENGQSVDLTTGSFTVLLHSPDRNVREKAFHQFYAGYKEHENTLGSLLASSIQKDVFFAKVRKFPSALDAALFHSEVPRTVYENLVKTVNEYLPVLHRYYDIRRKKMNLKEIHMYDVYVPVLSDVKVNYPWNEAVKTIAAALQPLGEQYVRILTEGLTTGRWCDRYENKGKRSGAFSYGSFTAKPYISINYKENVIDSMFTLAHEGGHSMHSHYSAEMQPFAYYDYVTFVAEVASTFNEDMLSRYLMKTAPDSKMKAWLINRQIDAIRNTLFRQTMFAEFEYRTHNEAEAEKPLSSSVLQAIYRQLLETYFGPQFVLDDDLSAECLRVPHFYRGFYVYQYATGISAALALAEKFSRNAEGVRDYLRFLSGGCSQTPIELLRIAGVDMESPQPIIAAMKRFEALVNEFEAV
ncbi:peptidase [Planctomycetales bacterium]|nr:peptidase [Planctomycetales bacterium]